MKPSQSRQRSACSKIGTSFRRTGASTNWWTKLLVFNCMPSASKFLEEKDSRLKGHMYASHIHTSYFEQSSLSLHFTPFYITCTHLQNPSKIHSKFSYSRILEEAILEKSRHIGSRGCRLPFCCQEVLLLNPVWNFVWWEVLLIFGHIWGWMILYQACQILRRIRACCWESNLLNHPPLMSHAPSSAATALIILAPLSASNDLWAKRWNNLRPSSNDSYTALSTLDLSSEWSHSTFAAEKYFLLWGCLKWSLCRKRRSIRSSQLKWGNSESCWGVWD